MEELEDFAGPGPLGSEFELEVEVEGFLVINVYNVLVMGLGWNGAEMRIRREVDLKTSQVTW